MAAENVSEPNGDSSSHTSPRKHQRIILDTICCKIVQNNLKKHRVASFVQKKNVVFFTQRFVEEIKLC